jgi:hypothetical protein
LEQRRGSSGARQHTLRRNHSGTGLNALEILLQLSHLRIAKTEGFSDGLHLSGIDPGNAETHAH